MSDIDTNPREIIGGNRPDQGPPVMARLELEYDALAKDVTALLAQIRDEAPETVNTDDDNKIVARHMDLLRTTYKRADGAHGIEKAPYLQSGRAVDQYFFGMMERLKKAQSILQKRGDDFTARKVAAERAERERLARIAAEEADKARRKAAAEAAAAAELEAQAARARKPENIERLETAAEAKGIEASVAQVDELIANTNAENAALATMATSASIARTRFDTGNLATAKQKPHVEILDADKLDMKALWPFIRADVKLAALKAWAKIHNHEKQMDGAVIELRDAADYR